MNAAFVSNFVPRMCQTCSHAANLAHQEPCRDCSIAGQGKADRWQHAYLSLSAGWSIARMNDEEILVCAPDGSGMHVSTSGSLSSRLLFALANEMLTRPVDSARREDPRAGMVNVRIEPLANGDFEVHSTVVPGPAPGQAPAPGERLEQLLRARVRPAAALWRDFAPTPVSWDQLTPATQQGVELGLAVGRAAHSAHVRSGAAPSGETPQALTFNDGWQNFICYLIDKAEGKTVTEEALQRWAAAFLKEPRYADASGLTATPGLPWEWQAIETAPKSPANGKHVQGIYLLGFCPDPDTCNLESAICVIWWEPLMKGGKGMWYGEGGYEVKPTHWQPLPPPPGVRADALPRCPHVPGAACPGAECQAKGCVRTHGVPVTSTRRGPGQPMCDGCPGPGTKPGWRNHWTRCCGLASAGDAGVKAGE